MEFFFDFGSMFLYQSAADSPPPKKNILLLGAIYLPLYPDQSPCPALEHDAAREHFKHTSAIYTFWSMTADWTWLTLDYFPRHALLGF